MTFSLCMIVKNEEDVLRRCLDPIKDLMDEIIIVDTGSTDGTKKIAAEYTDKVYDFEWQDDFAAARNYAFSLATGDYIYSADADEVVDPKNVKKFRMLKEALLPEIDIVQMYYTNQLSGNTTYNFDKELRPKLFKRLRTFVWEDPLHETVRTSPVIFDSDIEIKHCPSSTHSGRDFSMFRDIIKKDGNISNHLAKMYARELFIVGSDEDFLEALGFFRARMDKDEEEDMVLMDACVVIKCARLMDDPSLMLLAVSRAMASDHTPSEAVFELGEYYRSKRNYGEACMWYYNAAFETQPLLNIKYRDSYPFLGLHISYVIMGDLENAAKFAALAKERS